MIARVLFPGSASPNAPLTMQIAMPIIPNQQIRFLLIVRALCVHECQMILFPLII
jgi:hypothetical protein